MNGVRIRPIRMDANGSAADAEVLRARKLRGDNQKGSGELL
jgi:hypothetical protein